ncbi:MAG: hypothetical protein PWP45_748 [Tepidanaerobacteraceae bacterium]|jgi:hypothetical protein|nr:hypothetical protein [Tepidanaerobacteraceae bacterium]
MCKISHYEHLTDKKLIVQKEVLHGRQKNLMAKT